MTGSSGAFLIDDYDDDDDDDDDWRTSYFLFCFMQVFIPQSVAATQWSFFFNQRRRDETDRFE